MPDAPTWTVPSAVPLAEAAANCPVPDAEIVWKYLLPESRIRRRIDTEDVFSIRLGRRNVDIDVSLPSFQGKKAGWVLPLSYHSKDPIAPDLAVCDGSGETITVPTLAQNMSITCAALRLIAADLGITLKAPVPALIREVVFEEPVAARIARLVLEDLITGPDSEVLLDLLAELEDQFLLWVPLEGPPSADRRVRVTRRAPREVPPIRPRQREVTEFDHQTAAGQVTVEGESSSGEPYWDFRQVFERVLRAIGLIPIAYESTLSDTTRFASLHLCVKAPRGFVVRDVRAARVVAAVDPDDPDEEPLLEEMSDEPGLTVQGHGSEIAHVHCSMDENVSPLVVRTVLGIADHLASLWVMVVVFNAALLWAFDRQAPKDLLGSGSGDLQIAAAALLLVPTLAAAWAIRSDEGALMRTVLSGTRLILLASGLLSIAAALTLAGVLPQHFGTVNAIKLYASLAYVAAALVAVGWAVSRRVTWLAYLEWLRAPVLHFKVITMMSLAAVLLALIAGISNFCAILAGLLLLPIALSLAALAAKGRGASFIDDRGSIPWLAGVGAVLSFAGAGYWLGYCEEAVRTVAVQWGLGVGALMLAAAAGSRWYELER